MTFQPAGARVAVLIGLAVFALGTRTAAETIDLYGGTGATLGWAPASGPVVGYYVIVARNGGRPAVRSLAFEPRTRIAAEPGDEISIAVSAFDVNGVAGPMSSPSPTLRFNPADPDAPPSPPTGEPPPDETPGESPMGGTPPGQAAPTPPLDFDGDGVSDLIVRNDFAGLALWRMRIGGVKSIGPLPPAPESWQVVGGGDYDGNGVADILWQVGSRRILWLMSDGQPIWGFEILLPDLQVEHAWQVGGSGDFDGDGVDDLLLFSRILGEVEIVYFENSAVAERERLPGYAGDWRVSATADLDGDGVDEILWRDEQQHELVSWDMNGGGPESPSVIAQGLGGWRVIGAGDFDGDGDGDLFTRRDAPAAVQVLLLEDGRPAQTLTLPGLDSAWVASGVGDYDADDRADLVWSDPSGGGIQIWFSEGDGVTSWMLSGGGSGVVVSGAQGSEEGLAAPVCALDTNGDGVLNGSDFARLAHCIGSDGADECQGADMNADGVVNSSDVERILQAVLENDCSP